MALAWRRAPLAATLLLILQCSATTDSCVDNNAKSSACPEAAALGARALADAPLLAIQGVLSAPARVESLTVHVPYTRAHLRPGRLLVRFGPSATAGDNSFATLHEVEKRVEALDGIDLTHFLPGTRIVVVTLANGADADEAAARLRLLDDVEWAERDAEVTPDQSAAAIRRALDSAAPAVEDWRLARARLPEVYSHNHGCLPNHDQPYPVPVRIGYTAGDCRVAICHIDSGVNLTAATRDQYFYNPGEYAGVPGVDDDGNGVVDDFFGANFIAGNNNSMTSDHSGHGTATAHMLTATAPRFTLMPCKALNEDGVVLFSVAIQCIEWCKTNFENMRAHGGQQVTGIYSASWGGNAASQALSGAIAAADAMGATRALFVASAGNKLAETHFPASSGLANVMAVTHVDRSDHVSGNTGSWIDLAVPAGSSSEAAAVTAGVAGLLVSLAPGLAPEDIRSALVRSAAPLPTGVTFGCLDASAAFADLRVAGRLQPPATPPDRDPCVSALVWSPAWPSLRRGAHPCIGGGRGRACWSSIPAS